MASNYSILVNIKPEYCEGIKESSKSKSSAELAKDDFEDDVTQCKGKREIEDLLNGILV